MWKKCIYGIQTVLNKSHISKSCLYIFVYNETIASVVQVQLRFQTYALVLEPSWHNHNIVYMSKHHFHI